MAKITLPSGLVLASTQGNLGVDGNIWINTTTFKLELDEYGDLVYADGVSLQALYSFLKQQWKDNANLPMFKFPMEAITPSQFELINGWDFIDQTTKNFIRDGGWALKSSDGANVYEEWVNIQTLGVFDEDTDQAYYIHTADGTPTDFVFPGVVNQAVQFYGDASHGNFDYRLTSNSNFIVYLRIQGKTYASYNLNVEQAKAELTYQSYGLPLSNNTDLNINASDAYIAFNETESTGITFGVDKSIISTDIQFTGLSAGDRIVISGSSSNDGTYTIAAVNSATDIDVEESLVAEADATGVTITSIHQSMTITWGAIQRTIGSGTYDFSILIDANSGTTQEIYEFVQYQLRQSTDIDDGAGSEVGQISDEMLEFVGPTLKTKLTSDGGVYIDNFRTADTNSLVFVDDLGEERSYPFVAAGTINFNSNLQTAGANAKYWMFFTDGFNTAGAIIVDDNSGVDIAGTINGVAVVEFDFDYDNNVQGGRTAGTDAPVTLVAIGTTAAQYVTATGTIIRSTVNAFTLTAALERNYIA